MNHSIEPLQQTLTGLQSKFAGVDDSSEDSSGLHALADATVQRGPLTEEFAGRADHLTTPAVQVTCMVDIICIQK